MHRAFKLTKDITGLHYERFLRAAVKSFPVFMLVWRDQFTFRPSARTVRRHLRPFQIRVRHSNRWPGNIMFGHKAELIYYRSAPETLQVLERPGSMMSWLQPHFPEDLAFFGPDRKCALASVTHERDIWILDRAFAQALPKTVGTCEENINDKDWKDFYDYVV